MQVRRGNRGVTTVTVRRVRLRSLARRAVRRKVRQIVPRRRRERGWRKVAARPLFRCGACRKGFSNPLGHVCDSGRDFGKRRRAAERAAVAARRKAKRDAERRRAVERNAAVRKRAAERLTAVRRAERAKADARVAKARAARKTPRRAARPAHDYRTCQDQDCGRRTCEAFREGLEAGDDRR